jgi:hypothetical protein
MQVAFRENTFMVARLSADKNFLTSRSSTAHFVRWTVFKAQFCGFAAQKYSTKPAFFKLVVASAVKFMPLSLAAHPRVPDSN